MIYGQWNKKTPPLPEIQTHLSLWKKYLPYCLANLTSNMSLSCHAAVKSKLSTPHPACHLFLASVLNKCKTDTTEINPGLDKSKELILFAWTLSIKWHQFTLTSFHCSFRLQKKCNISTNIYSHQLCFRTWNPEQATQKCIIKAHTSPILEQA